MVSWIFVTQSILSCCCEKRELAKREKHTPCRNEQLASIIQVSCNSFMVYSVKGFLGEGSFSRVFKIEHRISGKQYAGKHLKTKFKGLQDLISCTEISVMKRIENHRNILNLQDIYRNTTTGAVVLVFELMDMNLYEFLKDKQKPLSEAVSREFFYQLTSGLQYLHANSIYHRDVKPENILLKFPRNTKGICQEYGLASLKLADFGSVKSVEAEFPPTEYIGTRWYRAPECIITTGFYGPKMDVWSAACIFYEMLTLKPLFPGESELDQLEKIHQILGSPSEFVMRRFRHLKTNFEFEKISPTPFSKLLPNLSKLGLHVLKMSLSYLPETRISSKRLADHSYFSDMRRKINHSARNCTSARDQNLRMKSASSQKLASPKNVEKIVSKQPIMSLKRICGI